MQLGVGLFGFIGLVSMAAAQPPQSASAEASADALSARYLQLRKAGGHFGGASWNGAVDAWGGEKHTLMRQLARHVVSHPTQRTELHALMGAPDQVLDCRLADCEASLRALQWVGERPPASRRPAEIAWYDWRGRHDRLVFVLDDKQVYGAGWLHAYE
ncbi:hypothetical protein [Caldimonas brevitalea]|uniref:Uncharacterized protein n=1 Tax=Caldimonas brevitalea TaxID=413882 RepID=A0A0G3BJJ4_9BURK|nr:hypothetical protein [Caldimonas brevitalea]AKJ29624.1 hypothetical protein AAW51_2933 [Caldimonas brevitalea]